MKASWRRLGDWFDVRVGHRSAIAELERAQLPGGASMMYVFGTALGFLLVLQLVTGILLAMSYSASTAAAWASVAYLEDQTRWGWFIRGVHHYGASAVVITTGLHLLQTAIYGAYKKPREVNWALGLVLLGLVLAFALTGYLLPWDATGFAGSQIAVGIAGSTPLVGSTVRGVLIGGNDFGNFTLTRFFALHVLVLPVLTTLLVVAHVRLYRRHGATPRWGQGNAQLARRAPQWPDQIFRDVCAMAIAFGAIALVTVRTGGAGLDQPADPSATFDARPPWYFRPLFQALKYVTGSTETLIALGVPLVVGGYLLLLPFFDRGIERNPRRRWLPLAPLLVFGLAAGGLGVRSYLDDAGNQSLATREARSAHRAAQARRLAVKYGVPPEGGAAVFTTAPFYRARQLWTDHCASCHTGDERKAPVVGLGYASRAWIRGFLTAPSDDRYFGRTKLAGDDVGMAPVKQTGAGLDALVELIYAETGAADADPAKVTAGKAIFDTDCTDCRTITPGELESGPNLARFGSRLQLMSLLEDAGAPQHFGTANKMPKFDELAAADRERLADYLIWLRTASQAQLDGLDEE